MTDQAPSPGQPARSQRALLLLRILLLLLARAAVAVAVAIALRQPATSVESHVCPMHSEVRSKGPSECPICGMALERLGNDAKEGETISPDQIAYENVRRRKIFSPVRMRSLPVRVQEIRGPSWVTGDQEISVILYRDQIDSLSPHEPGRFSPSASPKTSVAVIRVPGPAVPWDGSTAVVRFRTAKTRPPLLAGQIGWLEVAARPRSVATLPFSAVLHEPEGPYALVWTGGHTIEKRRFQLGESFEAQGIAVVLSGLRPNDFVVSRAAFFMDANRRLGSSDQAMWSAP